MSKIWLVAERYFKQEVFKRSFLIAVLSLPLFLGFSIGMGYLGVLLERDHVNIGYVDQADVIQALLPEPSDPPVTLIPFASPQNARTALDGGQIDAYYVLPPDYGESRHADLIYDTPPAYAARRHFQRVVRWNLLAGLSPEVVERVMVGGNVSVQATETAKDFDADFSLSMVMPLLAAVLFAFLILTASGNLMGAVAEEKENRTIEVVITSISTTQMMAGKVIATLGIALTLLAVWLTVFLLALWLGGSVLDIPWLQNLNPNWRDLGVLALISIPTFLFVSAFMIMLGSTVVDTQEADQVGPLIFMMLFVPIYLFFLFAQNPNGPVAIVLSFFPPTAVSTLAIRSMFMTIPAWQVVAAVAIGLVGALLMIWLAAKAFRLNMLRYGQRLRLSALFGRAEPRVVGSNGK